MCISAYASTNSFLVNLISAICLIFYGNSNLKTYNLILGLFAIYTSLMQLVDLGIWTDLRCKTGTNKLASLLGPVLVFLQPIMIFVIAYLVLTKTKTKLHDSTNSRLDIKQKIIRLFDISSSKFNLSKAINIFYGIVLGIFLYVYYTNTHTDINCSKVTDGSIKWGWLANSHIKYYNMFALAYFSVGFINFLSINPTSTYIYFVMAVYIILLIISFTWKKTHLGEVYCYISNSIPLILLGGQKLFKKYLN